MVIKDFVMLRRTSSNEENTLKFMCSVHCCLPWFFLHDKYKPPFMGDETNTDELWANTDEQIPVECPSTIKCTSESISYRPS